MTHALPVHLICSIGTGDYRPVTYEWHDQRVATRFAPVALARLLGLRGRASVLVTAAARQGSYDTLAGELRDAGLEPDPITVPKGRNRDEIMGAMDALMAAVIPSASQAERVILDVTFALRHLPFVYLAALTYLTAVRGITLDGIYYGAYDLRDTGTDIAPIIDLTDLFRLTRWYHALRTATDTGDLRAMAELLRQDVGLLFQTGRGDVALSRVKDGLRSLSEALAAGLPVEVGLRAADLAGALARMTSVGGLHHRLMLERLAVWIAPLAASGGGAKQEVSLTDEELGRQLRLAEWHCWRGDLPKTLLLLREWLVSFVMARNGLTTNWLAHDERKPYERLLGAMAYRAHEGLGTADEAELAGLWNEVADKRNQFAHAGMTEHTPRVTAEQVGSLIDRCRGYLQNESLRLSPNRGGGRVLVTPLGLSPGVVYTGIVRSQPDHLVVVTSAVARERLEEALGVASAADLSRTIRVMADPHGGYREADDLVDADLKQLLVNAREVVVNLTGGTTAMQLVVERAAATAHRFGSPVRRVMLIDERPLERQRADPYVLGDLIEVTSGE